MNYEELIMKRSPSPDFGRVLAVLGRKIPDRPVLFEFFLNGPLYAKLARRPEPDAADRRERYRFIAEAFLQAGYDYTTILPNAFGFPAGNKAKDRSISLNDGTVITDRKSFEGYRWQDPAEFDYTLLDDREILPDGMRWIVHGPGGVLENAISLVGYDNLCFMLADDPPLAGAVFEEIGSRLLTYYRLSLEHEATGAIISNDDWGFKSQTMLSPADMRKHVFPWHREIVRAAHDAGKPAILHSCGQHAEVMDDIVDLMEFDGKHSYEDPIAPVEEIYEEWSGRVAILGGIDVDYVIRRTPEEVYLRSRAMVERSADRGGFALGTGNSVPYYIPDEHYFAMISAAFA